MKDRDIVVIGLQPWDIEIGSNCKNIALEMAKSNRVLYVNNPLDVKSLIFNRRDPKVVKRIAIAKEKKPFIEEVHENIWVLYPRKTMLPINWLKWRDAFDFINKINNRYFSSEILIAIHELNFQDYYLFNDNSIFLGQYQKENLLPQKYIYYIRDNLSQVDYWQYHSAELEPSIIVKADVVVTNSEYYRDYAQKSNPHSYMVGQGCDLTNFSPDKAYTIPADLKGIDKPMIGYVGFLSHRRLDINLLVALAERRPEWQLVLVGPEDEQFTQSSLHSFKNVFFLGAKEESLIPTYIYYFDVCLNPQLVNEITVGNYPRKIDEYLAMGKPVVASVTKAMEYFKEHVYLGENASDYEKYITTALNEDNTNKQQARIQLAKQHTWANSVENIYQAISKV